MNCNQPGPRHSHLSIPQEVFETAHITALSLLSGKQRNIGKNDDDNAVSMVKVEKIKFLK